MAQYSSNTVGSYSEDCYSSLFEPDVVLPSQFMLPDEQGLAGGERKLMAALLSDGIEAYIAHCTNASPLKRRPVTDACDWVETIDYTYVFSFDNVCACLGIDPDYLRMGLMRYVEAVKDRASGGLIWKKIRRPRKH